MITKEEIIDPISVDNIKDEKIVGNWGKIKYYFRIYRSKKFEKGDNLISLSFFMLKEVDDLYAYQRRKSTKEEYEKDHKKKVKKYLDGLKNLIWQVKKQPIKYTIRIYCDITTIKYSQRYLSEPNVELYMYFFPQFFNMYNGTHIGFFGTLIRYLPLFKLEHHNDKEWETTTIMDLDLRFNNELKLMKYYVNRVKMQHVLPNIMFQTSSCYFTNTRMKYLKMYPSIFTIISSFIIQKTPENFGIFKNFLEDLLKDKFYNYNRVLDSYLGQRKEGRLMKGRLEYGVDEYFINKLFLQKLYLDKNRSFLEVFIENKMGYGLVQWFSDLRTGNVKIKNERLLEQFIKVYVALFFPKNYIIKPYNNIHQLIEEVGEDSYQFKMSFQELDVVKYDKLKDIIRKVGPEKLNMNRYMLICMERSLKYPDDRISILLVKPNPAYPKYDENAIDYIKISKK